MLVKHSVQTTQSVALFEVVIASDRSSRDDRQSGGQAFEDRLAHERGVVCHKLGKMPEFRRRIGGVGAAAQPHHHPFRVGKKVVEKARPVPGGDEWGEFLGTGEAQDFVTGQQVDIVGVLGLIR
jgi:hypothetical protein